MTRERYPLEPARKLREHAVDEATDQLARSNAALEEAKAAAERAQAAVRAHDEETDRIRAREGERDIAGRTVAEMQHSLAYLERRGSERAELSDRVRRAQEQAREAREAAERARSALADARAERDAVEKHHDRWQQGERRKAEARAEAEAEDVRAGRGK